MRCHRSNIIFYGMKIKNKKNQEKKAYGLIDHIINRLPEIHIPGYQFCGPGTELEKRLKRGDSGINELDRACRDHDIAYENSTNSESRHKADKKLVSRAFKRIYSKNANLSERAAALLVSSLVGAKIGLSKIGLGLNSDSRFNNNNTYKKMNARRSRTNVVRRKRKTTTKRKVKGGRRKRNSVKFGGAVRRVRKRAQKKKTIKKTIKKTTKKQRVLKLPPRFIGRIPSVRGMHNGSGSGMYLKPYHR